MSWQAALSAVIMLILEFRTEKKGNVVCFGSCFWKVLSALGIKSG